MHRETLRDVAAAVAAGAAVLLLVDLSLAWHHVEVSAGKLVVISADANGWNGSGLVAGLLAIALLVSMIRPLRSGREIGVGQAATAAALGVATLAFTVAASATGSASISTPATGVEVGSRLWPAYAGIALAAVVAIATVTALVAVVRGATAPVARAQQT